MLLTFHELFKHVVKQIIRLLIKFEIPNFPNKLNQMYFSVLKGDASSPHGATCVQYSISSSGGGNTSSDFNNSKPSSPSSPAGSGNGTGNEGLTRQQLDLISQIMQQTKQASTQVTISANHNNGMKSYHQARPRTWNMQVSCI